MLKTQSFCGSRNRDVELDTHNGKIYIPKPLCKNVIDWCHIYIMHSGATRTLETINQHLYLARPTKRSKVRNKKM